MIKKMITKKVIISSLALLSLFLLTLFPKKEINPVIEIEYVSDNNFQNIYLLNNYNLLSLTKVICNETNDVEIAKDLLEVLINGGKGEDKIPNGFKSIIPSDTIINNIEIKDNTIKVDFSKELLDVDMEYEEKIIEDIVYTLTSINNIKNVIIYIDGEILSVLPKSGKVIPTNLTRKYGINKIYDITNIHNVESITTYFISYNDKEVYYIPVTKYVNNTNEKILVVIDELSSGSIYQTNLISYLNNDVKVKNIEEVNNILRIDFNEYLFNDLDTKDILEEVIETIFLSAFDNYDVEKVVITIDNEEIYEKVLNSL